MSADATTHLPIDLALRNITRGNADYWQARISIHAAFLRFRNDHISYIPAYHTRRLFSSRKQWRCLDILPRDIRVIRSLRHHRLSTVDDNYLLLATNYVIENA